MHTHGLRCIRKATAARISEILVVHPIPSSVVKRNEGHKFAISTEGIFSPGCPRSLSLIFFFPLLSYIYAPIYSSISRFISDMATEATSPATANTTETVTKVSRPDEEAFQKDLAKLQKEHDDALSRFVCADHFPLPLIHVSLSLRLYNQ